MDAGTVRGWSKRFGELANRVGPCFARHDLRTQATGYLRGQIGRASCRERVYVLV